jgi:hypothetical protein
MMIRELKEIERHDAEGPVYLRFSNMTIERTESYANGEVNVDIDHYNEVVGIEMLSFEPEEFSALGDVAKKYNLSFDLFFKAARR